MDWFHSGIDYAFNQLLVLSFHGSVIVIAVMIFQRFFNRALSPKWIYALWMLVLVRFVLVIAPASSASFQNWLANNEPIRNSNSQIETATADIGASGHWTISSESDPAVLPTITTDNLNFSWVRSLALVWGAGCLILLWRFGRSWMRTRQIVNRAQPAPASIARLFEETKSWSDFPNQTQVLATDQIDTPAACGLIRPKVLLPVWCLQQLDENELRCIFVHELTHLKKKDVWIQLTAHLVSIAHWFNPLVAFANRKLDVYREMACDQRSLELLTRFNVDQPKVSYGNVILRVATYCSEQSRLPEPLLVGSFVDSDKHQIQQRIAMLVQIEPPRVFRSLIASSLVLLIVVVGFTSAQTVDEPKVLPNPPISEPAEPASVAEPAPALEPVSVVKPPAIEKLPLLPPEAVIAPHPMRLPLAPDPALRTTEPVELVRLDKNEIRILEFDEPIPELMVADPEIVAVSPRSSNEIILNGKSQGWTDLTVVFASGKKKTYNVGVAIIEPLQVVLDLKIITVDKEKFENLAIDFESAAEARSANRADSLGGLLKLKEFTNQENGTVYIEELQSDSSFLELINHIEKGLPGVGTVSAPKIVTLMSHEASFRTGGELPVEKVTKDGIAIEFKPFGRTIKITPRPTDDADRVELQVHSELSKLVDSKIVPLRKLSVGVQIKYGNTLATVGLYEEDGIEKEVLFLVTPSLVDNP